MKQKAHYSFSYLDFGPGTQSYHISFLSRNVNSVEFPPPENRSKKSHEITYPLSFPYAAETEGGEKPDSFIGKTLTEGRRESDRSNVGQKSPSWNRVAFYISPIGGKREEGRRIEPYWRGHKIENSAHHPRISVSGGNHRCVL